MEYIRISSIGDPYFDKMHSLMQDVFPKEEVLERSLWAEPLRDQSLRVYVAVLEGEVVGATEYRYLAELQLAMTDFTIVAKGGLGVGRFLWRKRAADLVEMARSGGGNIFGMLAEVYNPERSEQLNFGKYPLMHPVVRREVLSHMGYQRLDFPYVHPSWENDGTAVTNLDLCLVPTDEDLMEVPSQLIVDFLNTYYAILPNKPKEWLAMVEDLKGRDTIQLRPL